MAILLRHAEIGNRDCKDCLLHIYDETKGIRELWRGKPVRRHKHSPPQCYYGRCKKGSPDAFRNLLPHNIMAYQHYLECKATGHFENDPIVKRNARIIRSVEDGVEKAERVEDIMMSLAPVNGVPGLR